MPAPTLPTFVLEADRSVTFQYESAVARSVLVAGNFTEWARAPLPLVRAEGTDRWSVRTAPLPCGVHAYKLIVDGTWQLDPGQGRRKYVGGVENSAIKVRDCALPALVAIVALCLFALFDPAVRRAAAVTVAISVLGFLGVHARAGMPAGPLRPAFAYPGTNQRCPSDWISLSGCP